MYNEPPALYDKNTVELMIEEQQEEIRRLEEEAQKRVEELRLNKEELKLFVGNLLNGRRMCKYNSFWD